MIDGVTCWAATKALHIESNTYLIGDNDYFDEGDSSVLPEFIPGDLVRTTEHEFSDKALGLLAKELVRPSGNPNKYLFEFLFKAAKQTLRIDMETKTNYSEQIQEVKERELSGEFFYPTILDTIRKLNEL